MAPYPGFIGGSYQSQSVIGAQERTVNLYVESIQTVSANRKMLLPTPGFTRWSAVPDVGGRGFVNADTRMFGVFGGGLSEFDSAGTATARGTVAQDSNPAQLIYNGLVGGQLGICSGGNVYKYDLASNVLSAALLTGGYTHLAYAGGFGLAFNPTTGKVNLSNLNDLGTWSAGQFFRRSLYPDPWRAMFVDGNNLVWLPGTETFEAWYNTGVGTQPFAPLSGLVGQYGIAAPFAHAVIGGRPYWMERNREGAGSLILASGAPQALSTYPIDSQVEGYQQTSTIANAEILAYQISGHTFLNVAFPGPMVTQTYDVTEQSWAERGIWNALRGEYDLWAPRSHVYAFGKHLVGDRTTGTVWWMNPTVSTDVDGTGIRRLRRAPGLTMEHARVPYDVLELLMDTGVGTISGQGSNPQVMLRVSDDGGYTFGNQRMASVGKIGDYRRRVYWNRLAINTDAVFEVSLTDPVPMRIVDAWINNHQEGTAAA
jgi:hypothetical protein